MSATHHLLSSCVMTVAVTALLGATAAAETPSVDLVRDVQRAVIRYAYFTVFDDVSVGFDEDGVVTLTGHVTLPNKKTDLGKRVAAIDGVSDVRNEINVLPVSQFDNELRYRVALAIYGSSAAPADLYRGRPRTCHPDRRRRHQGRHHARGCARRAVRAVLGDQRAPAARGHRRRARSRPGRLVTWNRQTKSARDGLRDRGRDLSSTIFPSQGRPCVEHHSSSA